MNQSFFKEFELVSPWCTTENIFLLFDYIHLIKSLRDNWITEKMQELKFCDNGSIKLPKWNDLKKLYDLKREVFQNYQSQMILLWLLNLSSVKTFP